MKKISFFLTGLLIVIVVSVFQACDNDSEDYWKATATVVKPEGENVPSFVLDGGTTVAIANTNASVSRLEDGERVWIYYNILGDIEGYDKYVRLNGYRSILTKDVIEFTEEMKDSIGDDPVRVYDIWVSTTDFLTIRFIMNVPLYKKHMVNLVHNTEEEYEDDGYAHLEYRYNNMNDVTNRIEYGTVSFRLGEYSKENGYKGVKVRLNSSENGEIVYTYDYSKLTTDQSVGWDDGRDEPETEFE
ncbi:MAG: NigD-like protein [Bacteroides sp.]|nr:NigD-like protein [Bacteroides sp.]